MPLVETKIIRTKKRFDFNADQFVREGIGIIVKDIRYGINSGIDLNNTQFRPLAQSTIERKRKPHIIDNPGKEAIAASRVLNIVQRASIARGTSSFTGRNNKITVTGGKKLQRQQARYISKRPTSPLIDGGNLEENQSIAINGDMGTITIGPERNAIGSILQNQKGFRFFGISVRAEESIRELLRLRWGKAFTITRI